MLKFLGIGAQKAGTTWLYEMLSQHPDIYFPLRKEQHFWNREFNGSNAQEYLARFNQSGLYGGDITPAYGHLPIERIQQIRYYCPDIRIIYILRNPIDRAWSSALMALRRAEMTIDEASDQWFIDHFKSKGSMQRGDYEQCLRNWYQCFPKEQVLVLFYEDLSHHPVDFLQRCCEHIGVRLFFRNELGQMQLAQKVFSGPGYALRPRLHDVLKALYQSRTDSLARHLGRSLSAWE